MRVGVATNTHFPADASTLLPWAVTVTLPFNINQHEGSGCVQVPCLPTGKTGPR